MDPVERHAHEPDASFDGGDLDCGGGLLLLIRRNIDPLEPGSLLEILSTDSTVEVELPAWCRLTGNELVSWTRNDNRRSYLVSKGTVLRWQRQPESRSSCRRAASRGGFGPRVAASSRPCSGDSGPVGDGHRQLAQAGLDAADDARAPRGAARRGRVPGSGGRRGQAEHRRADPGRGRCRDGRRAAEGQLLQLRWRPARQLPAHPPERPDSDGRRPGEVRERTPGARRPRGRGPAPGGIRQAREKPPAGGTRGGVRPHMHRQAREGRAARAVPAHQDDVARLPVRPPIRDPRGARPGCGPRASRGGALPACFRSGAGAARRAGAHGGSAGRAEVGAQLHVRRAEREAGGWARSSTSPRVS